LLWQLAQQTAKDEMQPEVQLRHRMTSLAPAANQMNDVRPRDSKRTSADVTDQTSMQREMAVRNVTK